MLYGKPVNLIKNSVNFNFFYRKKDSSENFKKILKFFISLFPEFQSSLEISQNNEKNSHQFSLFVNTLLSKKNKDEFLDIFLSIYPCSEQVV